jgi:hypothetical protein
MSRRTKQNKGKAKARKALKMSTLKSRQNYYFTLPNLNNPKYSKLHNITEHRLDVTQLPEYVLKPAVDHHLIILLENSVLSKKQTANCLEA